MCGSQFSYNLYLLFEETALKNLNKVFLWYNEIPITFKEALHNVHSIAYTLQRYGVESGTTVILQEGNTPYFVYCFFAILQCNAIPVLVNPLARQFEIEYYCSVTKPQCIITSQFIAEKLKLRNIECKRIITVDESQFITLQSILSSSQCNSRFVYERSSAAAIIFTSAIDGFALGAVLTHHGIYESAKSVVSMLPQDAKLTIAVLPLFHAFGLTTSLIVPLYAGLPILLVDKFSPKKVIKYLKNEGIKVFVGVPAMFSILKPYFERGYSFPNVQLWVSGGEYLPKHLQMWYYDHGVEIRQGYGLTEASPIVSWNMPGIENKIGSVGKPMPYNQVVIEDENGNLVNEKIPGEIVVRGINVISEYYNEPLKTKMYIKEGWLHTGDIGYYDDGYLYICGRKKDMIIKNGYNVYPKEVERLLHNHPFIAEVSVRGEVTFTEGATFERLIAMIKPTIPLSSEEIRNWCYDNISLYKIPDEIIIQ